MANGFSRVALNFTIVHKALASKAVHLRFCYSVSFVPFVSIRNEGEEYNKRCSATFAF